MKLFRSEYPAGAVGDRKDDAVEKVVAQASLAGGIPRLAALPLARLRPLHQAGLDELVHRDAARPQGLGKDAALARREAQAEGLHRLRIEPAAGRSEEHTSELQSLMRISSAVFCL